MVLDLASNGGWGDIEPLGYLASRCALADALLYDLSVFLGQMLSLFSRHGDHLPLRRSGGKHRENSIGKSAAGGYAPCTG